MKSPLNSSAVAGHAWRPTFSLRKLMIVVFIVCICLGLWTQRGRWYLYQLKTGDKSQQAKAWTMLGALNGLPVPGDGFKTPPDVWTQTTNGNPSNYVWVRHKSELRCIAPNGRILKPGIALNGPVPDVLWNGVLPDQSPGIAFRPADEPCVLCVAVSSGRVVPRLLVSFSNKDVAVETRGELVPPRFIFSSLDGDTAEIAFPHGPLGQTLSDAKTMEGDQWTITLIQ